MKIKLFSLIAFGLLCGSIAYATSIEYIFTNASNFTLNGVSYTGPYLGLGGDELTFTMHSDTDDVVSSEFNITNPVGITTVSFGGTTLATLTDPTGLFSPLQGYQIDLIDETDGDLLVGTNVGPYDGVSAVSGAPIIAGDYPGFGSIGTNIGPLAITSYAYQGSFSAVLGTPSTVPEPSSILLLATGALGLAGVFRRRLLLK